MYLNVTQCFFGWPFFSPHCIALHSTALHHLALRHILIILGLAICRQCIVMQTLPHPEEHQLPPILYRIGQNNTWAFFLPSAAICSQAHQVLNLFFSVPCLRSICRLALAVYSVLVKSSSFSTI
jgi:hypothetical protein